MDYPTMESEGWEQVLDTRAELLAYAEHIRAARSHLSMAARTCRRYGATALYCHLQRALRDLQRVLIEEGD